jgi:hypothetical protein
MKVQNSPWNGDLHEAFNLPYAYSYKFCRQQAEVIQNHENGHIPIIWQGEADVENIRGLNLVVLKLTTVQLTKLPL